ncbi:MAG TPA: hypothetical protein VNG90_02775 [Candidatus Acidoferrum sp.]|nr:hypothetical protein [Candidatus Acidoferrum sp.]
MRDPFISLANRADISCGKYFLREENLPLPKPAEKTPYTDTPSNSTWQPTRQSFWDSCLGELVMVVAVLMLCTGLIVGAIALLRPAPFVGPAASSDTSSSSTIDLPPNSVQLGSTVLTCSGEFKNNSSPNASFVRHAQIRPLSSLIGANPLDGIGNAINGCAQSQAPVLSTSTAGSPNNSNSSSGITLVCKSKITVVIMVTLGDKAAYDPSRGWYALGRQWPSADPGDYILRNPDIDNHGISAGDNLNIYIFNGPVTVKLPGYFLMVLHGTSDDSSSILQGLYYSPWLAGYHMIIKGATLDDAELIAQTVGVWLPDGEVDY